MNIIYVAEAKIPSEEANVVNKLNMINSFVQNGHKLLFILIQNGKLSSGIKDYINKQYNIKSDYKLLQLPFFNKRLSRYLAIIVSKLFYKYDIIVTRSLPIARYANCLGLKVIIDSHRPKGFQKNEGNKIKELERKVFMHKNTVRVISTTESGAEHFRNIYGNTVNKKLKVARNGAQLYDFNNIIALNKEYDCHAAYCGQLYEGRGIEIIYQLILKNPNVYFHIAGGPNDKANYWKKILKKSNNVRFYGYLDQGTLISLRNSCDILLAPYQERVTVAGGNELKDIKFACPIKIFEYMASKKPIISSRLPTIMEVLENNKNVLLAEPDDIDDWIVKLQSLINNKRLREKLANQAYNDFINQYTWNKRAEIFVDGISK